MTLPPVVADPEGPCPNRYDPRLLAEEEPHDWGVILDTTGIPDLRVCRYCGGRKP